MYYKLQLEYREIVSSITKCASGLECLTWWIPYMVLRVLVFDNIAVSCDPGCVFGLVLFCFFVFVFENLFVYLLYVKN